MTTESPSSGHNLATIVQEAAERILHMRAARQQISDDIAAERKAVKAAGMPLKAFDTALKLREMDAADREELDNAIVICRDALGVPAQGELPLELTDRTVPDERSLT